jgi:hypothetical protein
VTDLDNLVLFADLARSAKSPRTRDRAVKKLCNAAKRVVRPQFDAKRLKEALIAACVALPDYEDPVVFESNKLHINGTFDVSSLSDHYFAPVVPETIDA